MNIHRITENDVVATFLKAEINSSRWREHILNALKHFGNDRSIIDQPDLHNKDQNISRTNILGFYRGYKQNKWLFLNFPNDMQWQKVYLDLEDIQRIRYLKQCLPWSELSGGTLLVADAAQRIQAGSDFSRETKEVLSGILEAVEVLKSGQSFPEVIIVAQSAINQPVALEGHVRLTAYLLHSSIAQIPAIIGYSRNLLKWEEVW